MSGLAQSILNFFIERVDPGDAGAAQAATDRTAEVSWIDRSRKAALLTLSLCRRAASTVKGAWKWKSKRSAAPIADESAASSTPPDRLSLIDDKQMRADLDRAIDTIDFATTQAPEALVAAVAALAAWVGPLGASRSDHDAGDGGLVRHSIRALRAAATSIKAAVQTMRLPPDVAAIFCDRIKLALAVAVLFHDSGKIYDAEVSADGAIWDPPDEPLSAFLMRRSGTPARYEWRPGRGAADDPLYHANLTGTCLTRIVPDVAWTALRPLGQWLVRAMASAHQHLADSPEERVFGSVLRQILYSADHAAASTAASNTAAAPAVRVAAPPRPSTGAIPSKIPESPRSEPARTGAASEPLRFLRPTLTSILKLSDLTGAIERFGVNDADSPILLGGLWVGIDATSDAYRELIEPTLKRLLNGTLLSTCDRKVEEHPADAEFEGGRCRATRMDVTLALEATADCPKHPRSMVFVSTMAFDRPIPGTLPSFPGRVNLGRSGHSARLHDLRFVIPRDGVNMVDQVTQAIQNKALVSGESWHLLVDSSDRRVRYVGLAYPQVMEQIGGDQDNAHRLWDRLMRLRVHMIPKLRRSAHTINAPGGAMLQLYVFNPVTSEEILARLDPGDRKADG